MKELCRRVEGAVHRLLDQQGGHAAREDSRAFGAMIEARITEGWTELSKLMDAASVPPPGRRTIYDFAFILDNMKVGFDVKTKDLDGARYSDGGVCAVGNLLSFLGNEGARFMIIEVGHDRAITDKSMREVKYVRVAPFDLLPIDSYRIENLGTGQVRLNYSVEEMYGRIEWGREPLQFLSAFTDLAIEHYARVKRDADARILAMEQFRLNGYKNFKMQGAR